MVGNSARRRANLPGVTDFTPSAGLDLKWHPTQDLTLDATINPDFAQVEADQLVLNLTTFETYYPEKRPFFLEGTDVFATPGQLLYTRRIGRVPPLPTLRPNEQLARRAPADDHLRREQADRAPRDGLDDRDAAGADGAEHRAGR